MWYDIHSHFNNEQYTEDTIVTSLEEMIRLGVRTYCIGYDMSSSERAVSLAQKHSAINGACIGVHPQDTVTRDEFRAIEVLADQVGVVGIGECGFDFHWKERTPEEYARQRTLFEWHIELAEKHGLPLMLHIRDAQGKVQAYHDAIDILREHPNVRANFHFFAGTHDILERILKETTHTVSYTGVVTFADSFLSLVQQTPLDRMHIETDAPYVSPVPYRGKKAEPWMVVEIAKKIADIHGISLDILQGQLEQNHKAFFTA